jgi:hypothetical protein
MYQIMIICGPDFSAWTVGKLLKFMKRMALILQDFIHNLVFRTEHESVSVTIWRDGELNSFLSKVLIPITGLRLTDLSE